MSSLSPSSSPSITSYLQLSFQSISKALETGDFTQSEPPISELVHYLTSLSDDAIANSHDDEAVDNALSALSFIHSYLSHPSLHQDVIDALSFELPKVIAKSAGVSQRCSEIVDCIIDHFVTKCSPRDMISVFCEALDLYGKTIDAPGYVTSILHGLSKVFLSIQRRHFEQTKVSVPVILNALSAASVDEDGRDVGLKNLFEGAINIANSIQATCKKLEGTTNERLRALLGLYVLQVMTIVSISMGDKVSNSLYFVQQLSSFIPYFGLSYSDLIAGQGVDPFFSLVCTDDDEEYMKYFSYAKHGALLSVIWGHVSVEVTQNACQDLSTLKDELRSCQSRRSSAIGMLKFIFSLGNLPWTLKKHAISFLLEITENLDEREDTNEDIICSFNTPSLISSLQGIVSVIMCAPDAELRKSSLVALKRVLADTPATLRIDMVQVLVKTSCSSSMKAILLDCVRENLRNDYRKPQENKLSATSSCWSSCILDLVEFILKPPTGGPPSLPEQSDAVLSALNLYRYILISESTGKTNYTGVMSKSSLQEAYNEWLLPLRVFLAGMIAENKNDDYDQLSMDIVCGLNPVHFVLYRCIELVEEKLKQIS